jgi:hypothetical protein
MLMMGEVLGATRTPRQAAMTLLSDLQERAVRRAVEEANGRTAKEQKP